VVGQQLAKAVASVLIQKGQCESTEVPCAFSVNIFSTDEVVHIGKGVAVSGKCVADLLELDSILSSVEDDKDRLLEQHAGFRVGDGLLDRIDVHVTTCGTEDHALKANLSSVDTTPVMEEKRMSRSGRGAILDPSKSASLEVTSRPPPVVNSETARNVRHEKRRAFSSTSWSSTFSLYSIVSFRVS
jgi:hypothetical protein